MDNMVSLSLAKTEGIYFCPKRKLKPHLNFKLIEYNDQKKRTKRLMINKNNTGNYTPQKT
jgi:hypothetical protein